MCKPRHPRESLQDPGEESASGHTLCINTQLETFRLSVARGCEAALLREGCRAYCVLVVLGSLVLVWFFWGFFEWWRQTEIGRDQR